MKIAIRYQSRGGNTKAVAEIIAKTFDIQALTINEPIEEYTDILFLGGGVYEWKMDKSLLKFIENLSPEKVGQIVAFSTTGLMDSTLKQIREAATNKKIKVNNSELLIKMTFHGHALLGLSGGKLNEKQQEKVHNFLKKLKDEM